MVNVNRSNTEEGPKGAGLWTGAFLITREDYASIERNPTATRKAVEALFLVYN